MNTVPLPPFSYSYFTRVNFLETFHMLRIALVCVFAFSLIASGCKTEKAVLGTNTGAANVKPEPKTMGTGNEGNAKPKLGDK